MPGLQLKRAFTLFLALMLLIIGGCSVPDTPSDDPSGGPTTSAAAQSFDPDSYKFEGYDFYEAGIIKKTDGVTGIEKAHEDKAELEAGGESKVMLFSLQIEGDSVWHYPVLVIDGNGKLIYKKIPNGALGSYFTLCDIDGDGYGEIVTQCCIAMSGGAGGYASAVYKLSGDDLDLIYSYDREDTDTGFYLELSDGFKHTVRNKFTSLETSFTRDWKNPYFDKKGKITELAKAYNEEKDFWADSFKSFEPKDIDGDGVYEILTAQYCCLLGHVDDLGTAYTVLKYDKAKKEMRVIKAGFWDSSGYRGAFSESEKDAYFKEADLFSKNWYK